MTPTELRNALLAYLRRELELPAQAATAPGDNPGIIVSTSAGEVLVIVGRPLVMAEGGRDCTPEEARQLDDEPESWN